MQRRKFILLGGTVIVIAGITYYLQSDTRNFVRADSAEDQSGGISLKADERQILYLASLAPSGHNTQPWLVKYKDPYNWIICNDKTRWLNAVDPDHRETILSIGAFLQNLEYAGQHYGYDCEFKMLASSNQDEDVVEVKLRKVNHPVSFDIEQIKLRRTVRSNYHGELLKKSDLDFLLKDTQDILQYIPNSSKEHQWLNEQTIEANRVQAYRDDAQMELAEWIRFSSKDAKKHSDGLTLAGMEMEGIPAWILRNYYTKADVMKKKFREQSIDKVVKQVRQSAGWFIISSNDNSIASLLQTGKRMQQLFLKVRSRNIAIHPMTQILEEAAVAGEMNIIVGSTNPVQFILRTGYIRDYPAPVSLRRPVSQFIKSWADPG